MEEHLNEYITNRGRLKLEDSGQITYAPTRSYDHAHFYRILSQKFISSSFSDTEKIENIPDKVSVKRSIDILNHDVIHNKIDGFYTPECLDNVKFNILERLMMHYRRNSRDRRIEGIYEKRFFMKYRFMKDFYNVLYTVPCSLMENCFGKESKNKFNNLYDYNESSKFIVVRFENINIFIYSHTTNSNLLMISNENNYILKEIAFPINILEVKIIDDKDLHYEILIRLPATSYIYQVKFKDKLDFNLLYKYETKGSHFYTTKNFIGEYLVCSGNTISLYKEKHITQNIVYDERNSSWRRGIFTDHPQVILQISDNNINLIDLRMDIYTKLESICDKIQSKNEMIYPILDFVDTTSFNFYFCTKSRMNIIDLRNTHNFHLSVEHGVNFGPFFQTRISGSPLISILIGRQNRMKSCGRIFTLNGDLYSLSSIAPFSIKPSYRNENINGSSGYLDKDGINIFLYDSIGNIYHQKYVTVESDKQTPINYQSKPKSPLCEDSLTKNTEYREKQNRSMFYNIINNLKKENFSKTDSMMKVEKRVIEKKRIFWENFVKNDVSTYKDVHDIHSKWFPEENIAIPKEKSEEVVKPNESKSILHLFSQSKQDFL